MKIKQIAAMAAALTATFALTACGSSAKGDQFTVGIKFDQPGLGLKEGATYKGFDVDVAKYVAKKLGKDPAKIKFVESVSAQRENMIQNDQVDMIVATYSINDKRKEKVSFAGPYFVAGQGLLVRADNTSITGPDAMDGKKLCSVKGSTPAQKIKEKYSSKVQLQEYETYSDCVEQLIAGTIDAVTTDDVILAGFANQEKYKGKLKLVGEAFSEEKYGIGVKKGSEMCTKINTAIGEMIKDGSWEKALKENAGDFKFNTKFNPPTPGDNC